MGRSGPWRCTTSLSQRPPPETTLDSTSRTSPSRTSSVDTSPPTQRTSQLPAAPTSLPRSSCLTTLDRSATVTLQSWIVTPLTLPASSTKSRRRSIVVPVRPPRLTPSSSSLVMLVSLNCTHPSPCALRLSPTPPHLDVSPSVT